MTQWQQHIRRGVDIDCYPSRSDSTLRKYSRYIDRIQLAWKMPVKLLFLQYCYCLLALMQKMIELVERASCEDAAIISEENVSQAPSYLTRTTHTPTSSCPTLSDASLAVVKCKARVLETPKEMYGRCADRQHKEEVKSRSRTKSGVGV